MKGKPMLAYVEITSDEIDFREGRNDNGYWSVRRQKAFMHQGEPYPTPFEVALEEKQQPYNPGKYVLAGGSFRLGKYGLELGRNVKLLPVSDALAKLGDLNRGPSRSAAAA
jgi:hypothetical protein